VGDFSIDQVESLASEAAGVVERATRDPAAPGAFRVVRQNAADVPATPLVERLADLRAERFLAAPDFRAHRRITVALRGGSGDGGAAETRVLELGAGCRARLGGPVFQLSADDCAALDAPLAGK
jgi:hypothetical protein